MNTMNMAGVNVEHINHLTFNPMEDLEKKIRNLRKGNYKAYVTWVNMKQRCYNISHPSYKYYGERGIIMSEIFKNSSKDFIDYLKTLPDYNRWLSDNSLSIDRIDNELGYIKGNLQFSTKSHQVINTRLRTSNKSGYRGVNFHRLKNKWQATITINRKKIFLGSCDNPKDAAILYNNYIIDNQLTYKLNIL